MSSFLVFFYDYVLKIHALRLKLSLSLASGGLTAHQRKAVALTAGIAIALSLVALIVTLSVTHSSPSSASSLPLESTTDLLRTEGGEYGDYVCRAPASELWSTSYCDDKNFPCDLYSHSEGRLVREMHFTFMPLWQQHLSLPLTFSLFLWPVLLAVFALLQLLFRILRPFSLCSNLKRFFAHLSLFFCRFAAVWSQKVESVSRIFHSSPVLELRQKGERQHPPPFALALQMKEILPLSGSVRTPSIRQQALHASIVTLNCSLGPAARQRVVTMGRADVVMPAQD